MTAGEDECITVCGTAGNAHAGAMVLVDGEPVYIDGLSAWDAAIDGKVVEVTGVPTRHQAPAVDDDMPRHGILDSPLILAQVTWRVVDREP